MEYQSFVEITTLLITCGYMSYRITKWLNTILGQRKNMTPQEILESTLSTHVEKQNRETTKYGSRKKTLVVNIGTAAVLMGWCYSALISTTLFYVLFAYMIVGFVVLLLIGAPKPEDLAGLKISDRLWLRMFHAWLWPVYVMVLRNTN